MPDGAMQVQQNSSGPVLTDAMHDWVHAFTKIDSRGGSKGSGNGAAMASAPGGAPGGGAPEAAAPGGAPGGVHSAAPAAAHGSAGGPVVEKELTVSVPKLPSKKFHILKGMVEVELKPTIEIKGTVGTTVSSNDHPEMAAMIEAAKLWQKEEAEPEMNGGGLLQNLKFEREGPSPLKGFSLKASSHSKTRFGELELEVVFAAIEPGLSLKGITASLKVLTVSAKLFPKSIAIKGRIVHGVKLSKLSIRFGGELTVAPAWKEIILEIAKKQGLHALEEMAESTTLEAGEVAAVVISGDAIIVGSVVGVSVAVIVGGFASMAMGIELRDLSLGFDKRLAAIGDGFKAAMRGEQEPGDEFGKMGHKMGLTNYEGVFRQTKAANKGASDDAIKAAVAKKASPAWLAIEPQVKPVIRRGLWEGFLANNKILTGSTAAVGFRACFSKLETPDDPEWKKYLDKNPILGRVT